MDLALITYSGWCAIKPNQTKPNQTKVFLSIYTSNRHIFVGLFNTSNLRHIMDTRWVCVESYPSTDGLVSFV